MKKFYRFFFRTKFLAEKNSMKKIVRKNFRPKNILVRKKFRPKIFSMKNIFREKNPRHKNRRFRHFHQNLNDEISDFPRKYFFIKIFFIEKKIFPEKMFFLQIHAISFYVTKYGHITPNSLGGSSRIKKKPTIFADFEPT